MNQKGSVVVQELSQLVSGITGVQLGERQSFMVETRLKKRMMDLGLTNEEDYLAYLHSNLTTEKAALISLLTTHHTSFFREFAHFEYLEREALPQIIHALKTKNRTQIKIWSSACSTGQEVYTLSMFLKYALARLAPDMTYSILGTDVSAESIEIAKNGVYLRKETKEIPLHFLVDHWARGTGEISEFVKAKKSIKDPCSFKVVNLFELQKIGEPQAFDLIFCRNVFIYFNADQIRSITRELMQRLLPHGYLFLGISESLHGLNLPVKYLGPSVYSHQTASESSFSNKKKDMQDSITPHSKVSHLQSPPFLPRPSILRVLCVDDSPSILTLLKQVFKRENGFEIVGTASNGIEAAQKVRECRPDVLTLDIHMPMQDGISYLKTAMNPFHPPVVMVSAVSRESSDLALKALELGAADYVEKPSLTSLPERGEEIRTKLNYAFKNWKEGPRRANLSLDQSFSRTPKIENPSEKIRLIMGSVQNRSQYRQLLSELSSGQPPTLIFIEGFEGALEPLAEQWTQEWKKPIQLITQWPTDLKADQVYLADLATYWSSIQLFEQKKLTSILVYGTVSKSALQKAFTWRNAHILLEDSEAIAHPSILFSSTIDRVPSTSFAYLSSEFLGKRS